MNSTISALQNMPPPNIGNILNNPFVKQILKPLIQYAISPTIVVGIFLFLLNRMFKFGTLSQTINTVVKDIEELKKDGKKLLSYVDIIRTHLVDKTGLDAGLFAPGSPLRLLPVGIKILDASGFRQIYRDDKKWFVDEIKKEKVKTLSDIDDASLKILEKCRNCNKFTDYKELAFQNGITIDTLLRILAIYLRDELAKEVLNGKSKPNSKLPKDK